MSHMRRLRLNRSGFANDFGNRLAAGRAQRHSRGIVHGGNKVDGFRLMLPARAAKRVRQDTLLVHCHADETKAQLSRSGLDAGVSQRFG